MHEFAIAESLVSIIRQEMDQNGLVSFTGVKVVYGQLTAIVPEALETAFQCICADTPLAEGKLEMEMLPLRVKCGSCSQEFQPEDQYSMLCPYCQTRIGHHLLSGKELYIAHIEGS